VHPALSNEDRILITKQLLKACDYNSKQGFIPNQVCCAALCLCLFFDYLFFAFDSIYTSSILRYFYIFFRFSSSSSSPYLFLYINCCDTYRLDISALCMV
jgi:hypothetical protein